MSDDPSSAKPMMKPEKARDIGRGCKWLSEQYAEVGMVREAAVMLRDSNWWLAYSIALANTKPEA